MNQIAARRTVAVTALSAALLGLASISSAAPVVRVTPPAGARFAVGQLFDLRVEFTPSAGATLTDVRLFADDTRIPLRLTDLDAFGGYTLRAQKFTAAGVHNIRARATDSTGTTVATSRVEAISLEGGTGRKTKNVILLVGDGMGASHRTAARLVRYGAAGGYAKGSLAMETMPGVALIKTASLNSIITDSAPGMSNYVTGNKARNNEEGVFPDNTPDAFDNPRIEYLSEFLHRTQGKALGVVSTADLEDATPAANAVHTSNRGAGTGIMDQFFDERHRTGLSVLLGGGRRWFLPTGTFGSSRATTSDYVLPADIASAYGVAPGAIDPGRDLIGEYQAAGFSYASNRTELAAIPNNTSKLLGLFAYGNMNVSFDKVAAQRGNPSVVNAYHAPDQPMLDEMTGAALKVLSKNPQGFVLMVEGAHIDKQSHLMDADRAIWDTIEFDRAVQKALDFARQEGNTIVLVTADHECAGFSIIGASLKTIAELEDLPSDAALTGPTDHPARQAAVGPYEAAEFPSYEIAADGFPVFPYPATFKPIQIGFGGGGDHFEDWLSKPLPAIDSLIPADIRAELVTAGYPVNPIDREPESSTGEFLRGPGSATQAVHTATDIPLTSFSSGSEAWRDFVGMLDNTDVFFKILKATDKRQ